MFLITSRKKIISSTLAVSALAYYWHKKDQGHLWQGVLRNSRITWVGLVCSLDYKWTLLNPTGESEKSQLHKRSAQRVLKVLEKNGGIYIKL